MSIRTYIYLFGILCLLTLVESLFDQIPIYHGPKSRQEVREELGGLPEAHLLTPKEKQQYIKDEFVFSWQGYRDHSWGYDENRPVTNRPRNTR